ncbi:MAG: cytochrome c biogenesis protein CcsA [Planctomycetota bacterium]|jgi:cytochrome c-type biogenesis protein CcsB
MATLEIIGVRYAVRLLWLALCLHTAAGIVRWVASGHAPVTDSYELNLTGMWFTVLVFLIFQKLGKIDASIGLVVTPIAFLVLGQGLVSRSETAPMGQAFKSLWLIVHVVFAWLAFGCYAIATGAAILLLLREKFSNHNVAKRIPPSGALDLAGYRFIVLGFINHAVMLVSGTIWAKKLWGHYWSWDALETWSLIAFLFYAVYLHTRAFLKWKMQRAAWLAILGLVVVAISFWGVEWFAPSVHPGP